MFPLAAPSSTYFHRLKCLLIVLPLYLYQSIRHSHFLRIIHGRAAIWNSSSSVHIDIERVSAANEWHIECEHEKINSISPSVHVLFCLLYKHTNNDVFEDFPKISDHFPKIPKIFQNCFEGLVNVSEHFPKIAEGSRRFPRRYRWCFDHTTPPLSDYVAIAMAILRLVTTTWYFYT